MRVVYSNGWIEIYYEIKNNMPNILKATHFSFRHSFTNSHVTHKLQMLSFWIKKVQPRDLNMPIYNSI